MTKDFLNRDVSCISLSRNDVRIDKCFNVASSHRAIHERKNLEREGSKRLRSKKAAMPAFAPSTVFTDTIPKA